MTRIFAAELEVLCSSAFIVIVLAEGVLASLLKLEVIRGDQAISGHEMGRSYGNLELLRMHKSLFKISWKRCIFYISAGALLLAVVTFMVLYVNESFMDNKLLHLISRGR